MDSSPIAALQPERRPRNPFCDMAVRANRGDGSERAIGGGDEGVDCLRQGRQHEEQAGQISDVQHVARMSVRTSGTHCPSAYCRGA